ncbi:hypothetical protein PF003_g9874 [Phytophthora fragariae]|nr:hypothetical protein PF003_g9874 [Phytophthora fragariae]
MQEAAGALLVMSTVTAGHLLRAGPELNGPLNYVLMDGAAVLNVKTICEFVLSQEAEEPGVMRLALPTSQSVIPTNRLVLPTVPLLLMTGRSTIQFMGSQVATMRSPMRLVYRRRGVLCMPVL